MADEWTETRFKQFWRLMTQSHGSRFTREYGTEPNQAWMEELSTLTFDQVKFAIQEGRLMGDEHPPTLDQFSARARRYKQTYVTHGNYRALPKPELSKEKAKEYISKLRQELKK